MVVAHLEKAIYSGELGHAQKKRPAKKYRTNRGTLDEKAKKEGRW